MPREMLASAIKGAEGCEPIVRAMVLMSAARVLSLMDKAAARDIFARGLAAMEASQSIQHRWMLEEAAMFSAWADPAAAMPLLRRSRSFAGRVATVVQSLALAGEPETALEVAAQIGCDAGGLIPLIGNSSDHRVRLRGMNIARQQWRAAIREQTDPARLSTAMSYGWLLSQFASLLGPEDARQRIEEYVQAIEAGPDSMPLREQQLVPLRDTIRQLWPADRAETFLARYRDPRVEQTPAAIPDDILAQWEILRTAQDGDPSAVPRLMEEAHGTYQEDIDPDNPNFAPRVAWPSCHAYRRALYWAGDIEGVNGERRLADVPDPSMALMARVEYVAGLLGARMHQGIQVHQARN